MGVAPTVKPTPPLVACSIFLVSFWFWNAAWHFVVITNVVDVTVSRSVTRCYSSPDNVEPMWASFRRVMNPSLGWVRGLQQEHARFWVWVYSVYLFGTSYN